MRWEHCSPLSSSMTFRSIPSSNQISLSISPAPCSAFFTPLSGSPADIQKRGASRVDWLEKPRSLLRRTWMWPWGCMNLCCPISMNLHTIHNRTYPPMTPKDIIRSSPWVTIPGMIVWYGLFPPLTQLGCPSIKVNPVPRFWRVKPQPFGMAPVPNPNKKKCKFKMWIKVY